MNTMSPLVSIIIPAYKPSYFAQALESALAQTWGALEVVVCDDSPGDVIKAIVADQQSITTIPLHYSRNPGCAGELGNTLSCIRLAQ